MITLGIIGVVAALTIPTLVAHNQEKGWQTGDTVFQRKLGEALQVMNTEGRLSGYTTTEDFVQELSKHLKITKVCDNDNLSKCFETSVIWNDEEKDLSEAKISADLGKPKYGTNIVGIQVANGTNALLAYNPACTSDPYSNDHNGVMLKGGHSNKEGKVTLSTDCLAILYDTTGFSKPNEYSKDVRAINAKLGLICTSDGSVCFTGPASVPTPVDCTNTSGEDYQYCLGSTVNSRDYFAGAVKMCGGLNKIISKENSISLINEIYGQNCDSSGNCIGDYNSTSASKYGLPETGLHHSYGFWLISNSSYNDEKASGVYFYLDHTGWHSRNRSDNSFLGSFVICVE